MHYFAMVGQAQIVARLWQKESFRSAKLTLRRQKPIREPMFLPKPRGPPVAMLHCSSCDENPSVGRQPSPKCCRISVTAIAGSSLQISETG